MKKILFAFLLVASLIATTSITYASDVNVMLITNPETDETWLIDNNDAFTLYGARDTLRLEVTIDGVDDLDTNWYEYVIVVYQDLTIHDDLGNDHLLTPGNNYYMEADGDDNVIFNGGSVNAYARQYDFVPFEIDASPVLDGQTAFVTTVDDPYTESEIRALLSAYDETDGNITHLIVLDSDNYTANQNTVGNYDLEYSVTDSAGNTSYLTVTVFVKDVVAPIGSNDSVSVSYAETFDIENYKNNVLVYSDNYDAKANLAVSVDTNDYTANKTNIGSYDVVFEIEDTSGNLGYATLTINVIDDVKPSFSGPSTLTKSNSETLTLSEITSQLAANDAIDGNLTSSIQVVSDGYTGNANLVGSYEVEYKVTDSAGNTAYHTVTIQVSDDIPPVFYVRDGYFISVSSVVALSTQDIIDILTATGQISVDGSGGIEFMMLTNEYTGNEETPGIYAMSMRAVKLNGEESVHNVAIEVVEDTEDDVIVTEEPTDFEVFWEEHQDTIVLVGASIGIVLLVSIASVIVFKGSKKKTRRSKKYKKRK